MAGSTRGSRQGTRSSTNYLLTTVGTFGWRDVPPFMAVARVPCTFNRDSRRSWSSGTRSHRRSRRAKALLCPPSGTKSRPGAHRCHSAVTTPSRLRRTNALPFVPNARKESEVSMRILIVTDAWSPQVNGVVTTVRNTVRELGLLHHDVGLITPDGFRTLPCPTYPEIRLAIAPGPRVCRMIEEFEPDAVHIETEAPLGMAARRHCIASGYPFTTAYHTQFPEFVHARCRLPLGVTYRAMRWFHDPAGAVMVPTAEMRRRLELRGFVNLAHWSRGVDTEMFAPAERLELPGRPIFLYARRVAVEKSIADFLTLDPPGTKG